MGNVNSIPLSHLTDNTKVSHMNMGGGNSSVSSQTLRVVVEQSVDTVSSRSSVRFFPFVFSLLLLGEGAGGLGLALFVVFAMFADVRGCRMRWEPRTRSCTCGSEILGARSTS